MEQWKDIEGFNGIYQVSTEGNIRSHKYNKTKLMKPQPTNAGYLQIGLQLNKKPIILNIHRLVLITFKGLEEGKECCHIDGNKHNNSLNNLRWDSRRKNMRDKIKHNTWGNKLKAEDVISLLKARKAGATYKMLSKEYDLHFSTIASIVTGRSWKHIDRNLI